ncbi:FCD domain-containing protein [Nocardia otitidiscaviarum]|uniref:FCD domain-containing protein n=1 Tax=Nocardia otitidiscaviarum TaxID=1823 RepID=UPI002B4B762F|nr:FCD domain-containing protein [Nocardia otitidiscaviarum]
MARPTAPPPATETVRPATAGGSAWPATGDSVARPAVSESDTTPPSPTPDSSEQAADAVPRTGTAPADPTGGWNAAAGDAGTAETRRTRAVHPVSRRPSETAAREPTTRQPTPDLPCQPAPRLPSQLTPRLPDQPTPHLPSQARARSARPRYDAAMIERELEIWQGLRAYPPPPGAELIAADERFHSRLLAASGNTALADALATVHARVRPIRALDIPTPERIAIMTAEHIAIAERLLAGDLEQGLSVLVTHITTSRDHVLARAEHALRLTKLARALRD